MQIEINDDIIKEFEYIIKLKNEAGTPFLMNDVPALINHVLFSIAEGSRCPGSWERSIVQSLGLIADCDAHYQHRHCYGEIQL